MPEAAKLRSQTRAERTLDESPFWGAADEIMEKLDRETVRPEKLYHYTSAAGLLGIVSEDTLRFSNALYLNDDSETSHGVVMAALAIDQYMKEKPDDEKLIAATFKEEIAKAMYRYQPVVFCMSDENNLLNQWRDYGNDVVPYAIEFDRQTLEQQDFNFECLLFKVIYNHEQQFRLLTELMAEIYRRAEAIDEDLDENTQSAFIRNASQEVVRLIWRFKNQAFEAEREWRLMSTTTYLESRVLPKFRTNSLGVVPYYERFRTTTDKRLPITSVTVGPTPYGSASVQALEFFLAHKGYVVPTTYSTIPIRR